MSKPANPDLSAKYVRTLLRYNKRTGELRWKVSRPPRAKKGALAGCQCTDGYWRIGIDGAMYLAHRIVWLIVTGKFPSDQIDHRHGKTHSLKWKELRQATHTENLHNQRVSKSNECGIKGVHKRKDCNRWTAFIQAHKKVHYLGLFKTCEEAAAAYKDAALRLHGEFAHL